MPFHNPGYGGVWLRKDIANILNSLEISDNNTGFAAGYNEAMNRIATALGLAHTTQETHRWTELEQRLTIRNSAFTSLED